MEEVPGELANGPESAPDVPGSSSRLTVVAVFGLAVAASAVLTSVSPGAYAFLLGQIDLLVLTVITAALGSISLWLLVRCGWFEATTSGRSIGIALGLGACLALPVIIVDLVAGFPAELNVRFPQSLLFYPSLALVAEAVFHLVPLALLASLWQATRFELGPARWFAIGTVALLEPMLQASFFAEQSSWRVTVFLGLYVLAFNILSLDLFRRSGFVALYALRLGYYLIWHIAWGHVRLPLLFGGQT